MNSDVKSAKRVLSILQFFAQTKAPATLTQISSALGFPKSSCLALLDTLEGEGYARLDAGRYYLTRRWLNEARIVAEHDQLTALVRPELERLRDTLGETLILGQRSGRRVVYLDVAEPDRVVRFTAWTGQTKPLHASASGRALLGATGLAAMTPIAARAQTRWQMATAYADGNLHTRNIRTFLQEIEQASNGRLSVQLHSNGALLKMTEIKRGVQTGQVQAGEILLTAYANEDPIFDADALPQLVTNFPQAKKLSDLQ